MLAAATGKEVVWEPPLAGHFPAAYDGVNLGMIGSTGARLMAKRVRKRKINKSQKIPDYLAANGSAGPTLVAKALKADGITVSTAMVSTIRSKLGLVKRRRKRRKQQAVVLSNGAAQSLNVLQVAKLLKAAKRLAAELGGIKEAKAALDALGVLKG